MRKKLVLLVAIVTGAMFVARKRREARAEADLWHEATSGGAGSR